MTSSVREDISFSFQRLEQPLLLVKADADFTILEASDGYLRLMGKRRQEVVGASVYEAFPENPKAPTGAGPSQSRRSFEKVVRDRSAHSIGTFRYDIPDPTQPGAFIERYWSPLNLPVFDGEGDVQYVLHCAYEVTDLVVQADRRRGAEGLSPSDKGRVLIVEPDDVEREHLEALFGLEWKVEVLADADELERVAHTRRFDAVFAAPAANDERCSQLVEQIRQMAGFETVPIVLRLGEDAVTDDYRLAYEAGADDVIGGRASSRELIARLQAQLYEHDLRESVLERSQRQIRELLLEAPVSIAVLEGPEFRYTFSNKARQERLLGRDTLGMTPAEAFPTVDTSQFERLYDQIYQRGEPIIQMDEPVQLQLEEDKGEDAYCTFAMLPLRDIDGEVEGIVTFTFEVTELVKIQKEVEAYAAQIVEESRRKDDFLAVLSHELRDPLAPIASAVDLLQMAETASDADRVRWAMGIISRQTRQLARLVDDLLDVTRISQGRIELQPASWEIGGLVDAAVETVRPSIDRRKQVLSVALPDTDARCRVDRERLIQVLTKLLDNASKFSAEGGRITVAATIDGPTLTLSVEDDGQGISAESLPHVFDGYGGERGTRTSSTTGLGLSLGLVKRLVEMHQGTVEAHSDGPGKGSRFTARLPVVEA